MKESEKLTIRFNFKSPRERIVNDKVGSDYHWGRIIGCSLAVVLIGSALIVGSNHYFNKNESVNQQAETSLTNIEEATPLITATSTEPKAEAEEVSSKVPNEGELATLAKTETNTEIKAETPINITDKVEDQTTLANLPKETPSVEVENKSVATKTVIDSTVNADTINTKALPITEEKISPETALTATEESKKSVGAIQSDNNDLIEVTAQEKNTQPSPFQTSPQEELPSTPVFTQSHIDILSDDVQRFIIAPRVINNEPIGTISDIKFDKNIAAIFAFTEVTDLKDTSLYYYWSLNGEAVTRVRVDVGGKSWRTYSSKIIQPQMRGEWTVEMKNKKGDTLAISRFTY